MEKQLFVEGSDVKKGDLLYILERQPFQAAVDVQKAAIAQAERNSRTPTFPSGAPSSGGTAPAIPFGRPRRRPPRAKRGGALQRALEHSEFSLLRLELTDRRGDLRRREDRRRHLIKQRLEYVVVASVDQQVLALPHRMREIFHAIGKSSPQPNEVSMFVNGQSGLSVLLALISYSTTST